MPPKRIVWSFLLARLCLFCFSYLALDRLVEICEPSVLVSAKLVSFARLARVVSEGSAKLRCSRMESAPGTAYSKSSDSEGFPRLRSSVLAHWTCARLTDLNEVHGPFQTRLVQWLCEVIVSWALLSFSPRSSISTALIRVPSPNYGVHRICCR